jgi:alkyl sulfatase BDS1-like metallo-beta-lactamase superfamily hydrolase
LARLRQTITKPVVAIIYTHVHHDHYGGAAAAVDSTIKMDRSTLLRLFAGQTTMQEAVTDGSVTISGAGDVQALPSIIE